MSEAEGREDLPYIAFAAVGAVVRRLRGEIVEEILTQEEIDELIRAATGQNAGQISEEEDSTEEEGVRRYDFRQPHRLSKDQGRALQRIHEGFAREFSSIVSTRLRTRVELTVNSIDQLSFGEFIRSIPNPSVINVYSLEPLDGSVIVQLSTDMAFLLYDRFCGGPGLAMKRSRELTAIEMAVMRSQFIDSIGPSLSNAWSEVTDVAFELISTESNPQFLQIMSERETIILISLDIGLNGVTDLVNICISYTALEPVLRQLTEHRLMERKRSPEPGALQSVKNRIVKAQVPVEVELGSTVLTVSDLLELEVRDVVPLDRRISDPLPIWIGDQLKLLGEPGQISGQTAVRVT